MSEIIIVGAGISGLSCAYHLKKPYILFEKERSPGGFCRSIREKGFIFDYTGHFLHSINSRHKLLGVKLKKIRRSSWIYLFDRYIPYPIQANIDYFPEKERAECYRSFFNRPKPKSRLINFVQWAESNFGKKLTEYFFIPYHNKFWEVGKGTINDRWNSKGGGYFVPTITLEEMKSIMKGEGNRAYGYNAIFSYPKKGGIQSLINAIWSKVKNVKLSIEIKKIDLKNKLVETSEGKKYKYSYLISTIPLPELIAKIDNVPSRVRDAARKLKANYVICLNIGIELKDNRKKIADGMHWVYFPEKKYPFYRIGFYGNIASYMVPKNNASMYVEVSRKNGKNLNIGKLKSNVISNLKKLKFIKKGDIIKVINILKMPNAYVIYDKDREKSLKIIKNFLNDKNIHLVGRYSFWEYSFMEKSMNDAQILAGKLNKFNG